MQDGVITVQQSTQGGFEVCWLDGGPLMRIFDSVPEALDHARMIADQAYSIGGFMFIDIRDVEAEMSSDAREAWDTIPEDEYTPTDADYY